MKAIFVNESSAVVNLMMNLFGSPLGEAEVSVQTFCASSHPSESCGANGLPLTPNSIRILGRCQSLKDLQHPHICQCIDLVRGKRERLVAVSEYFNDTLKSKLTSIGSERCKDIFRATWQILSALDYLHGHDVFATNLSQEEIRLDKTGNVKLFNYGLRYMTENGATVGFPIGKVAYMAPELICCGPSTIRSQACVGPRADIWSLGIILLELALNTSLWKDGATEHITRHQLHFFASSLKDDTYLTQLLKFHDLTDEWEGLDDDLAQLIEMCLKVRAKDRPDTRKLLDHDLFTKITPSNTTDTCGVITTRTLFSLHVCSRYLQLPEYKEDRLVNEEDKDFLSERSFEEVYHLWRLAGGDVEAHLLRTGHIKVQPPIHTLPRLVLVEGESFGDDRDESTLLDSSILVLNLNKLKTRLGTLGVEDFYALLEDPAAKMSKNGTSQIAHSSSFDLTKLMEQPLKIRETDIDYQLHRQVLMSRILIGYPALSERLYVEARRDIPPLYRGACWAALLAVQGDVAARYASIDKETLTATDRQIEVDIPRCHQYDELLSSPTAHARFKRVLKAWVVSHPQYVYWQGLDSLCAPFLKLHFTNEALAFACFEAFIDKYLHDFFLQDNSSVINEYLALFSHLIAYHDPELSNHMEEIGFNPSLYAIPWFLTMYAHVFPLHRLYHLWDTLLLGNVSFPLCVAVAIVKSMRLDLLTYDFNECILTFSDMPELDIEVVVKESIKVLFHTPRSAFYRRHAKYLPVKLPDGTNKEIVDDLINDPIPYEELREERCPRISAQDLLELLELRSGRQVRAEAARGTPVSPTASSTTNTQKHRHKAVVIDIRPTEDYERGTVAGSIHIPYREAMQPDGNLDHSSLQVLFSNAHRFLIKVVVSSRTSDAAKVWIEMYYITFYLICYKIHNLSPLPNITL